MQSNANIPFSFGGSDLATQNALMQSLNMGQNPGNNQNAMGGMMPNNNQLLGGFSMIDQSLQGNMPNGQAGMNSQFQGFNMPQNSMGSSIPLQMQQQMMSGNDPQMQQMAIGAINPQAFLAQLQNVQMQNGCGINDAMALALQGLFNAQRNQINNSGRDNSNSNNTVLLGGNQRVQSNQNMEGDFGGSLRLNTVYVGNLPQNVDHEMIKREFSKVGSIKLNSKSGMPMIWIFKDRGVPRGDALVTYDNNSSASNAVMYFQDNDFSGCRVEVRIATNTERPIIAPPNNSKGGGGSIQNNSQGPLQNMNNNNQYKIESLTRQNDFNSNFNWQKKDDMSMMNNNNMGGSNNSFNNRQQRNDNFRNNNNMNSNNKSNDKNNRGPDWICVKCSNNNFSWRDTCNRCQEMRADGSANAAVTGGILQDHKAQQPVMNNRPNFGGNRPNNKVGVNNNTTGNRPNFRTQDGGPMRGPKRSNSRPGPY